MAKRYSLLRQSLVALPKFYNPGPCGQYYKNITITKDTTTVIRMSPQLVSLTIVILMTIEVSFVLLELPIMLLETIYSRGDDHDDRHKMIKLFL